MNLIENAIEESVSREDLMSVECEIEAAKVRAEYRRIRPSGNDPIYGRPFRVRDSGIFVAESEDNLSGAVPVEIPSLPLFEQIGFVVTQLDHAGEIEMGTDGALCFINSTGIWHKTVYGVYILILQFKSHDYWPYTDLYLVH